MFERSGLIRVLYVEDNPSDADLVFRSLKQGDFGFQLTTVGRVSEALERLDSQGAPYDLALIDLLLPDGSGLDVMAAIRSRKLPIAVVLLTGSGTLEAAVAALKAGADDYLVKSDDYLELLPSTLNAALVSAAT